MQACWNIVGYQECNGTAATAVGGRGLIEKFLPMAMFLFIDLCVQILPRALNEMCPL
jgi:hypothetical protein